MEKKGNCLLSYLYLLLVSLSWCTHMPLTLIIPSYGQPQVVSVFGSLVAVPVKFSLLFLNL